jgi:hypothetical protein
VADLDPHIGTMNLDLTDAEAEALTHELAGLINRDRYPLSPRIRLLEEILGKLRPEPTRPAARTGADGLGAAKQSRYRRR